MDLHYLLQPYLYLFLQIDGKILYAAVIEDDVELIDPSPPWNAKVHT